MLSKPGRTHDETKLTPARVLERDVDDLVGENLISASRGQRLLAKAVGAGVKELSRSSNPSLKNAARAFKKRKLKHTFWPNVYVFKCPVWSRKQNATVLEAVAMWLPLELLSMIWELGLPEIITSTDRMDPQTKAHLEELKAKLGAPDLWGFGIHGDGVPNNYDKTESAQVISINLPGVGGQFARMRIPLCVLPSAKIAPETMDAIFEVIAWSLRHLQVGCHPTCMLDEEAWHAATDGRRQKMQGPLGFQASLAEVRGDWDFYSKTFHFPYHSELEGVCWLCKCRRHQVLVSQFTDGVNKTLSP